MKRFLVRVLVVENFASYREHICSIVSQKSGLQIIAEVSDGLGVVAAITAISDAKTPVSAEARRFGFHLRFSDEAFLMDGVSQLIDLAVI